MRLRPRWETPIGPLSLLPAHGVRDLHRVDADAGNALKEINEAFLVIRKAIRVELVADRRVFRRLLFVLIEGPFERRTAAELVIPCCAGNTSELGLAVELNVTGVFVRAKQCFG